MNDEQPTWLVWMKAEHGGRFLGEYQARSALFARGDAAYDNGVSYSRVVSARSLAS